MMRWANGTPLTPPPIVGQNIAVDPDGTIDPDAATDCGESCVSSVLQVATSYSIPPGCIREAMHGPRGLGLTSADDLTRFLQQMAVSSYRSALSADEYWDALSRLRHYGQYRVILGNWVSDELLHWVVAYERSSTGVWVMDPWTATHVNYSREYVMSRQAQQFVVADLWRAV